MEKFLDRAAAILLTNEGENFSNTVIVLPSSRVRYFLLEALRTKLGKTFWAPRFLVLPEFVSWISSKHLAGNADLLILLYKAYCNIDPDPESFEAFSKWGFTALHDFNDVDTRMVHSRSLFTELSGIREIESWSFNSTDLSDAQLKYLDFWNKLGGLYEAFSASLLDENMWSYGALLRWIISNEEMAASKLEGLSVYFIGLPSYSAAEMKLVETVRNSALRCEVLWDADAYYVDDVINEAGSLVRSYRSRFNHIGEISDGLLHAEKNIRIHEATTAIGQVYGAAELIRSFSTEELNRTCVVLADDKLLEPLLNALPAMDTTVNIGMGISLKSTSVVMWINALFRARHRSQNDSRGINYRDFLDCMQLFAHVTGDNELSMSLRKYVTARSWIFLSPHNLAELENELPRAREVITLLIAKDHTNDFVIGISNALESIALQEDLSPLVESAVVKALQVLREVAAYAGRHSFFSSFSSLHAMWTVLVGSERLHFQGEPADGLQILGMTETRALDFENVIVIGANEDALPGNMRNTSFIPDDLRALHRMPLAQESEAITAYTFYRLLHYPHNVYLFYSAISSDFRGTEQSRYITQLENELAESNHAVHFTRSKLRLPPGRVDAGKHVVLNDDFCRQRIEQIFASGLSPSAINKFNKCPLDFYYRYILGLGEEEELEEQMSAATFGSIVHYVLEKFYAKFKGTYPTLKDYRELEQTLDARLAEAIRSEYAQSETLTGFNHLARTVAREMLRNFLSTEVAILHERNEEGVVPILVDVEFPLDRSLDVIKYGWQKPVRLKGKGDRIEMVAGKILILDYKTGKVEDKDVKLDMEISEIVSEGKSEKLLQLLSYIFMYTAKGASPENVRAGFYSFRNHSRGYVFLGKGSVEVTEATMRQFEAAMVEWAKGVYNSEQFVHKSYSVNCSYCR